MGVSIIPGVLIIYPFVMMLTNGTGPDGIYTGAAYEGIRLLPALADKVNFLLSPLFGFSSPEAVGVPITALGSAGAATSLTAQLVTAGRLASGDIAVLTAMCMCWSGYLSTHVSMMNNLHCNELIGKAIGAIPWEDLLLVSAHIGFTPFSPILVNFLKLLSFYLRISWIDSSTILATTTMKKLRSKKIAQLS